jgi:hypothetical protein
MADVTFNANNLGSDTPKQVKWIYRAVMLASTLWVLTVQPNINLPEHITAEINKWLIVGNSAIYQICQFFGWSKPAS